MAPGFDMAKVRTRLLLDQPFFGTLAMHLELIADPATETLSTNGVYVKYNPAFLAGLTGAEQVGVLAHEVLHPALLHPYRRSGRDLTEWNEACDFAINSQLIASGFTLPAGVLLDRQFDGMSAEQIFSQRRSQAQAPQPEAEPEEAPEEQNEQGEQEEERGGSEEEGEDQSSDDGAGAGENAMPGCPTGEFVDGPETAAEGTTEKTAADWQVIAAEAAAVAQRAGDLPGGVGAALVSTREARVDWKAETQAFVTATVSTGHSWSRPNRRLVSRGLYLPGPIKENVGELVVAIDTSGSVTRDMLDQFSDELTGLLRDARPEKLHVVYCDTRVNGSATFSPDDDAVTLECLGGGGTRFQPVFDWVEAQEIEPLGLIYLTDLYGPEPQEPPYPVLWVTPEWSSAEIGFGQIVRIP